MEQAFSSTWAMTSKTYMFHADGTYERTSSGSPVFRGTYVMKDDTVQLLSGYRISSETLNVFYLLHEDSMLVDLHTYYEYAPVRPGRLHMSRKRYDLMPARARIPEMLPGRDSIAGSLQGKRIQLAGKWMLDSLFVCRPDYKDRMQQCCFGTQYVFGPDSSFSICEPSEIRLSCFWKMGEDPGGTWVILYRPRKPGNPLYRERMRLVFTDGKRAVLQGGSGSGAFTYYLSRP